MRYFILPALAILLPFPVTAQPLPGTKPLDTKDDLARVMVDGIHRYLDRATVQAEKERAKYWKPDFSSVASFDKSVAQNRERFRKIIGIVDERVPVVMTKIATVEQASLVADTEHYKAFAVRWSVLPGMNGEGLLLEPAGKVSGNAVAIPDADWTPEQLIGVATGVPKDSQYARRLAEDGYRVIVPTLINRKETYSG